MKIKLESLPPLITYKKGHRLVKEWEGKTIINVEFKYKNVITIRFTDGTSKMIWADAENTKGIISPFLHLRDEID